MIKNESVAFSFGAPEPVLGSGASAFFDYLELPYNGKFYEPPVSLDGLVRASRATVFHGSAILLKRNILTSCFLPHPLLGRDDFERFLLDYLITGNSYLESVLSRTGKCLVLRQSPSLRTRRGKDNSYYYVDYAGDHHQFASGTIYQAMQTDITQEIYGLPEYLPAMQSSLLNEAATIFRRLYYKNGNHAGYILYLTDPSDSNEDIETLRQAIKDSKGPGNFKNLFFYSPNGKKDGIQIIPISEAMAKDDFGTIKNITREDELGMHRVAPQLMGVIPSGTSSFGNADTAAKIFARNEALPIMNKLKDINDWIGQEVVRFEPYSINKLFE